jgi:hypothetical protein
MQVAKRHLAPGDLNRAFKRYSKLRQETARNIVSFYGRRILPASASAGAPRQSAAAAEALHPAD